MTIIFSIFQFLIKWNLSDLKVYPRIDAIISNIASSGI
jgi:hypothetical protein